MLAGLTGCKVVGGGQFASLYGSKRPVVVTLSANVAPERVKGEGEYQDKDAGVKAHLEFTAFDVLSLDVPTFLDFYLITVDIANAYDYPIGDFEYAGFFVGTYRTGTRKDAGYGRFIAFSADGGPLGPGVGDFATIGFLDGPYGGYVNGGPVTAGNFHVQSINP